MKKHIRYFTMIILTVLVFGRFGKVLEANYDGNLSMNGFYRMEKDTVDVMFYGSSHIYAGVDIVSLWDEYGIAGYDLAGTMQTLWNSYYNMEETLKYQTPKVMVVDMYGALIEEEYYTSTNVIKNASSMRFSMNKVRNIWNSVPHEDFLSYIFSYPLMHDSYKNIRKGNYVKEANQLGGECYKGFNPSFAVTRYDNLPEITTTIEKRPPSEKNIKYLEKMVTLTKEQQIELVFIVVPYEGWRAEDEAVYAWIEEFAAENDILFINGNHNLAEMAFDSTSDYAEASHLNYNGAYKFTQYLGQRLKVNYSLEDRRGEEKYDSWQKYSNCWSAYQRDRELAKINDVENYVEALKSCDEYVVFVSVDNNYKTNAWVEMLGELSEVDPYGFNYNGTFVTESGNLIYKTPDEPDYLWYMETDSLDIAVVRNHGEEMTVLVNNVKQNNNYSDVTILVYDKKLDMIADVATYNRDGVMTR